MTNKMSSTPPLQANPSASSPSQDEPNYQPFRSCFRNPKKPVLTRFCINDESLIEEMKCSLCRGVVPSPLRWACTDGHVICISCYKVAPCCAYEPLGSTDARNMCRQAFVQTVLQLYDRLYDTSMFHCVFKRFGCNVEMTGAAILQHCDTCPFKPADWKA